MKKFLIVVIALMLAITGIHYGGNYNKTLKKIKDTAISAISRNNGAVVDKIKDTDLEEKAELMSRSGTQIEFLYHFKKKMNISVGVGKDESQTPKIIYKTEGKEGDVIIDIPKKVIKKLGDKKEYPFTIFVKDKKGNENPYDGNIFYCYVNGDDHIEGLAPKGTNQYYIDKTIDSVIKYAWIIVLVVIIGFIGISIGDKKKKASKERKEEEKKKKIAKDKTDEMLRKAKEHDEKSGNAINLPLIESVLKGKVESYIKAIYNVDSTLMPKDCMTADYYNQMCVYLANQQKAQANIAIEGVKTELEKEPNSAYDRIRMTVKVCASDMYGHQKRFEQDFYFNNEKEVWILDNTSQERIYH